jgi:hypothetical protein
MRSVGVTINGLLSDTARGVGSDGRDWEAVHRVAESLLLDQIPQFPHVPFQMSP